MLIKVADLKVAADTLLQHLEENGHSSVTIPVDYYWSIPKESRYDPTKEPSSFTVGRLEDDWEFLQANIRGGDEPIGYALVWLAAILQAVGEEYVS